MKHPFAVLLLTAASLRAETVNLINAATLYAPVFGSITNWTSQHRDFSWNATNVSSAEADAAYAALAPHLAAMSSASSANFCDWGVRYEEGFAALLPHAGPVRDACRAANWAADYAAAKGEHTRAAAYAIEALRLGRNAGEDRLLISLLFQIAAEKPALEKLTRLVEKMDAGALDNLVASIGNMPPGTQVIEAMEMEKAMMVDTMLRDLMDIVREAGTNKLLAAELGMTGETIATTNAAGSAGTGARSWLTENLRLTSFVDSGSGYKLGFETKDGDSFVLAVGRPRRDIALLIADFAREEAVIARSNETALVKLKSREITALNLRLRLPDPKKLEALAAKAGQGKYKSVSALVSSFNQDTNAISSLTRDIALGGADGMVGLLRSVSDDYAKWIEAYKTMPREQFKKWEEGYIEQVSPLTKLMLPATSRCIDKEQEMLAARKNLEAAIAARRAQLR